MDLTKLKTPKFAGLSIHCNKCKSPVKKGADCKHYDRQVYKSRTKNRFGKDKHKSLVTRDLDEAIIMTIKFKNDIKNEVTSVAPTIQIGDITLFDAYIAYNKRLNHIDIPEFLKVKKSEEAHIKNLLDIVFKFLKILEDNGFKANNTSVTGINDQMLDKYCYWLMKVLKNSPQTYNNKILRMRKFFQFVIEGLKIKMLNPFSIVPLRGVEKTPNIIITHADFTKVIDAVGVANKYEKLGGIRQEVKNRFRPFLKEVFRFACYSGTRREEWATVQWSDIQYGENGKSIIIIDNKKVERITKVSIDPTIVPIHPRLAALLKELGEDNYKGSSRYILHPNRTENINTIMKSASVGFSHYYKEVFGKEDYKQLKCLRKTYMTELKKHTGVTMLEFNTHSETKTLDNHYINHAAIASTIDNNRFFE